MKQQNKDNKATNISELKGIEETISSLQELVKDQMGVHLEHGELRIYFYQGKFTKIESHLRKRILKNEN